MVQRVHATAKDQPIGDLLVALTDGKAWAAFSRLFPERLRCGSPFTLNKGGR
jgi:hypothetical protein